MKRIQNIRRRGFAFLILSAASIVVSSGLLFGFPSLLSLLRDEDTFSIGCDDSSDTKHISLTCLSTSQGVAILSTVCAVAFFISSAIADFLVNFIGLSGRFIYAIGAALICLGSVVYCIFVNIPAVAIASFGFLALGGGLMTASLQLGATKHHINGSKLTNTHISCSHLLGAAIYALLTFLHELLGLSSLVLLGGIGVATIFFAVLSIAMWPKGSSKLYGLPSLRDDPLQTSDDEADFQRDGSSHTEEEEDASGSLNAHQSRTSIDQIITRFAPTYGSVSETVNSLFEQSSVHIPRYGDLPLSKQVTKIEFIFFAIYVALINFWSVFFVASLHYRLGEAGAVASETEYTPLLVWMISASSVLVPFSRLLVKKLGLVGTVFLLHVAFSLWSFCLILRSYQLMLVSFVLFGATRGLLSGLETIYVRRLFGLENSRHLDAICRGATAIMCTLLYPSIIYSIDIYHQGTARGFLLPTIIQDACAAILLSLPVTIWIRNVDKSVD